MDSCRSKPAGASIVADGAVKIKGRNDQPRPKESADPRGLFASEGTRHPCWPARKDMPSKPDRIGPRSAATDLRGGRTVKATHHSPCWPRPGQAAQDSEGGGRPVHRARLARMRRFRLFRSAWRTNEGRRKGLGHRSKAPRKRGCSSHERRNRLISLNIHKTTPTKGIAPSAKKDKRHRPRQAPFASAWTTEAPPGGCRRFWKREGRCSRRDSPGSQRRTQKTVKEHAANG